MSAAFLREQMLLPSTNIVVYADSLGDGLAPHLATEFSERIVLNRSVPGQRANQIAMRQGGGAVRVTLSGNEITTGPNTVTHFNGVAVTGSAGISDSTVNNQPLSTASDNSTRQLAVTIADVTGTLERAASGAPAATNEAYTFTPDGGQTLPVTCDPQSYMIVRPGLELTYSFVYWGGRNNRDLNNWSVVSDVQAMIDRFPVAQPRGAILGIINGDYVTEYAGGADYINLTAANAELAAAFPDYFIDVRRYLIDNGLAALAITPTAQDLIDIANDIVPSSLRVDNIHLTSDAYGLVAALVKDRIFTPNGW